MYRIEDYIEDNIMKNIKGVMTIQRNTFNLRGFL